jgi:hypothetical protein
LLSTAITGYLQTLIGLLIPLLPRSDLTRSRILRCTHDAQELSNGNTVLIRTAQGKFGVHTISIRAPTALAGDITVRFQVFENPTHCSLRDPQPLGDEPGGYLTLLIEY